MNNAISIVVIDALLEIGQKGCYVCDGYGHCAEQCPTAMTIRKLFNSKDSHSNKLKTCITAAIAS